MGFASTALVLGATLTGEATSDASAIEWRWRRFQPWEYVVTTAALGASFYLRFAGPEPEADWKGGILFDDDARKRSAIDDPDNRAWVKGVSDVAFFGSMGYRLVDSVFVTGVGWGNWDTALQMSMIDLEAFGFVAITLWGGQALFGRQRPFVDRCHEPGIAEQEESCAGADDANRSFYAGHPAVGLTAAGLTCVHHAHLPLYGATGDTLACGLMLGLAGVNAYGRLVTEKHYASDLVVGIAAGGFAGFVLPALHYAAERPRTAKTTSRHAVRATVLPLIDDDRFGLAVQGIF
jgi:membrane-associated phospholipid phosphatase